MVWQVLEKPKCLAPTSVIFQTRHAFPRQDWPSSSHLSASQTLEWGTKETWPPAGVTQCQSWRGFCWKAALYAGGHKCSEMSMKLVEGEDGEGQSVAPLTWDCAAIWRDLSESLAVRAWGALRNTSLPPLLYKRGNWGPERGWENVQGFRASLKSWKIVHKKLRTKFWSRHIPDGHCSFFPSVTSCSHKRTACDLEDLKNLKALT